MNAYIVRHKLARASFDGLVRFAKHLKLHGCACGGAACRQAIEEKVARAMEQASMRRYASREGAPC